MEPTNHIDLEDCVVDLLIDHPQLLNVFEPLGIEYTCGGKSLRSACEQRGLCAADVIRICNQLIRRGTT
jgi:iron-sulfur cluster repair protein YtfE (RIC family)